MDVAQAFEEHKNHVYDVSPTKPAEGEGPTTVESPVDTTATVADEQFVQAEELLMSTDQVSPRERNGAPSPARMEQRRSSYEKYSAFIMPPLKEETTPVQSPAGTLARGSVKLNVKPLDVMPEELVPEVTAAPKSSRLSQPEVLPSEDPPVFTSMLIPDPPVAITKIAPAAERVDNGPLPQANIDNILAPEIWVPSSGVQSISVDVMTVAGSSATPVARDINIFYDSELVVIVHRSKVKSNGLVSTAVWSWRGKKNTPSEREEQKMQELARRYNTSLVRS